MLIKNKRYFLPPIHHVFLNCNLKYNFVKVICLGLVLFLLPSCFNENIEGEFLKEELAWLFYKEGEVLKYEEVKTKEIVELKVNFISELSQVKQYFPIEAEADISSADSSISFRIYLLKDKNGFKRYVRISEVYRPLDLYQPLNEVSLGGQIYKSVYNVQEDTTKSDAFIWKAYINETDGIIQFTDRNLNTYKRVK